MKKVAFVPDRHLQDPALAMRRTDDLALPLALDPGEDAGIGVVSQDVAQSFLGEHGRLLLGGSPVSIRLGWSVVRWDEEEDPETDRPSAPAIVRLSLKGFG
jgi:hypothetical protein